MYSSTHASCIASLHNACQSPLSKKIVHQRATLSLLKTRKRMKQCVVQSMTCECYYFWGASTLPCAVVHVIIPQPTLLSLQDNLCISAEKNMRTLRWRLRCRHRTKNRLICCATLCWRRAQSPATPLPTSSRRACSLVSAAAAGGHRLRMRRVPRSAAKSALVRSRARFSRPRASRAAATAITTDNCCRWSDVTAGA